MLLCPAKQHNPTETERLVVVTFQGQVGLLCLNADCSMSDAIAQMQQLFGVASNFTLENRGCLSQTSEIIRGASKISQIKFDQRPKGPKVIRLELFAEVPTLLSEVL